MNIPPSTLARVGLMAALTAVGAFIRIPFPYVPVTLQVPCVCLAGAWLGPRYGALSQVVYLLAGLLGFPVFAHGGGPQYLLKPSFGYLAAFPLAAWSVGKIGRGAHSTPRAIIATISGLVVVYLVGTAGLYLNLRFLTKQDISFAAVVRLGLLPLPKDLLLTLPVTVWVFRRREPGRSGRNTVRKCCCT